MESVALPALSRKPQPMTASRMSTSRTLFFLLSFLFFYSVGAQDSANYVCGGKVETEVEFNGGETAWESYVKHRIDTTVPLLRCAPPGTYPVEVRFLIEKNGTVGHTTAITKWGYGMEEELCRVLRLSPAWKPSTQNGKLTRTYRRQKFVFTVPLYTVAKPVIFSDPPNSAVR